MTDIESNLEESPDVPATPDRPLFEIAAVLVAMILGLFLGGGIYAYNGFLPASPILGMVFAIGIATRYLRRRGRSWADMGLKAPESGTRMLGWAVVAIAAGVAAAQAVAWVARQLGYQPDHVDIFVNFVQGDLINYLWMLVGVSWLSAGVGEEMILRGFVLNRFNDKFGHTPRGTHWAIAAQAILFGTFHFYQGWGLLSVTALALVFGYVYLKAGRNLWATIIAHAAIDSFAMTTIYLGFVDSAGAG